MTTESLIERMDKSIDDFAKGWREFITELEEHRGDASTRKDEGQRTEGMAGESESSPQSVAHPSPDCPSEISLIERAYKEGWKDGRRPEAMDTSIEYDWSTSDSKDNMIFSEEQKDKVQAALQGELAQWLALRPPADERDMDGLLKIIAPYLRCGEISVVTDEEQLVADIAADISEKVSLLNGIAYTPQQWMGTARNALKHFNYHTTHKPVSVSLEKATKSYFNTVYKNEGYPYEAHLENTKKHFRQVVKSVLDAAGVKYVD